MLLEGAFGSVYFFAFFGWALVLFFDHIVGSADPFGFVSIIVFLVGRFGGFTIVLEFGLE